MKISGWVNVYSETDATPAFMYRSRAEADALSQKDRIDCIYVEGVSADDEARKKVLADLPF